MRGTVAAVAEIVDRRAGRMRRLWRELRAAFDAYDAVATA
jgi:hypothetical protein